jgi:hypothetical protein
MRASPLMIFRRPLIDYTVTAVAKPQLSLDDLPAQWRRLMASRNDGLAQRNVTADASGDA